VTPGTRRRIDVLALSRDTTAVEPFAAALEREWMQVDVACTVADALRWFLARGGHELLVILPGTPLPLARAAVEKLREVQEGLVVVAFGREWDQLPRRTIRLRDYHPASRAGVFALLRVLRASQPPTLPG
jgi:hypothetical protein